MNYEALLPPPQYTKTPYKNGDTNDIVAEVIKCYTTNHAQAAKLAAQLQGSSLKQTCSNIWHFIKNNITYKIDPEGYQWVRTPSRLVADGEGDCKSFSVLAASLLKCLDVTPTFRFTSYNSSPTPTHVYVVVKQKGSKEIIIDAVINGFNTQKPYTYKKDITMAKIATLSGVGNTPTPSQKKAAMLADLLIAERKRLAAKNNGFIKTSLNTEYTNLINRKLAEAGISQGISGTSRIAGGFFGNILGINDRLRKELDANLPKVARAFLYLYIGGTVNGGINSYQPYSVIQNIPTVVRKRNLAADCFWDLRGQIDNISGEDLDNLIATAITEELGMTPKQFWTEFFNGSKANINGIGNSNDNEDSEFNLLSLLPAGFIGGLVGGLLPSLKFRPAISTFEPDFKSDFANTIYANSVVPNPKFTSQDTPVLSQIQSSDNVKRIGIGAGIAALASLAFGKIL